MLKVLYNDTALLIPAQTWPWNGKQKPPYNVQKLQSHFTSFSIDQLMFRQSSSVLFITTPYFEARLKFRLLGYQNDFSSKPSYR